MKIELATYTPVSAAEFIQSGKWVMYGKDNLYPQYLNELVDTTAIHGTLCKRIPVRISGKGTFGKLPADMDQNGFDKECRQMDSDLYIQGGFYVLVKYTLDGEDISKIKTLPFDSCRVHEDESGNVVGVWYSRNFKDKGKRKNKPRFYPLFDPDAVPIGVDDIQPDQIFYFFTGVRSGEVYPKPFYHGALNQIETERQIGMFDVNEILNGFFPSVIIDLVTEDTTGDESESVTDALNRQVTGARNNSKFVVLERPAGTEKSEITTFEPNRMAERYELKIKTIAQTLFIAHGITSPLLFGMRTEGGGLGSNKDEMKQAEELFTFHVIKPFQELRLEGLSKIMRFRDEVAPVYAIEQNSPLSLSEPATDAPAQGADVASQALNGAQIASLIDVIVQAATGVLTVESAKAIVAASFPTLSPDQVDGIFTGVVSGSINPGNVALALSRILEKKKPSLSPEVETKLIEHFSTAGSDVDPDWIEVDSHEIDYAVEMSVSSGTARPNSESSQDKRIGDILFIARYRYAGEITGKSRPFCVKMNAAGKVYRKEDIMNMGDQAVNPGWGPRGVDNYSVWLWKGGGNCHHYWEKVTFVSAKGLGIDVNSPKAKQIASEKAAAAGFKTRNQWKVDKRPIDLPNRGFLPPNSQ